MKILYERGKPLEFEGRWTIGDIIDLIMMLRSIFLVGRDGNNQGSE